MGTYGPPVALIVSVSRENLNQLHEQLGQILGATELHLAYPAICGGPMPVEHQGYSFMFEGTSPRGTYERLQQLAAELGGVITYSSRMPRQLGTLFPDQPEYAHLESLVLPNHERCRFEPYEGPITGGNA